MMTEKETNLLDALNENGIGFKLDYEDLGDSVMPIFVIGDLRLCVDVNYLITSNDVNELRFHKLSDLINFLIR